MSAPEHPEQRSVDPSRSGAGEAGRESPEVFPEAETEDFWDIDEALKHELINRSLRNMLGDC